MILASMGQISETEESVGIHILDAEDGSVVGNGISTHLETYASNTYWFL